MREDRTVTSSEHVEAERPTCAECGRDVGPGTREFATRVLIATKAGPRVVLCGSCGDPAKPFGRKWAIMDDPGALAAVSTAVTPRTGLG